MKTIFEQGDFHNFATDSLTGSREAIYEYSLYQSTVFISHKHDDLEDLKDLIGFLEQKYNIKAYIDSRDASMPAITSGETAQNIKDRIIKCNKFILLATNGAIESKWCNWELGYGDAQKYKEHIALFPMKPKGTYDSEYKGSEYMQIYPYIAYSDGTEISSNGTRIPKGYYIYYPDEKRMTSLENWFKSWEEN